MRRPRHEVESMNEIQAAPALRIAAGALSGAVFALVRARALRASRRLPLRLQRTLHRPLPWKLRDALAPGLRVGYGAAAGALLALLTRRRGVGTIGRALLAGATLGATVWAIGYAGWMPRARLVPGLRGQGLNHVVVSL